MPSTFMTPQQPSVGTTIQCMLLLFDICSFLPHNATSHGKSGHSAITAQFAVFNIPHYCPLKKCTKQLYTFLLLHKERLTLIKFHTGKYLTCLKIQLAYKPYCRRCQVKIQCIESTVEAYK